MNTLSLNILTALKKMKFLPHTSMATNTIFFSLDKEKLYMLKKKIRRGKKIKKDCTKHLTRKMQQQSKKQEEGTKM